MGSANVLLPVFLLPLMVTGFPDPAQQPAYEIKAFQNIDPSLDYADGSGGIWDIVFALMPQIEGLVQNVTEQAPPASLKEIDRFRSIIELFIPFMKKSLEFQAEDEGRALGPEDFEVLDAAELALHYISGLFDAFQNGGGPTLDNTSGFLPDYTDLLDFPDINIPQVVIPEIKIPDVTVPQIPGMPARQISLQNIPEVNIPAKIIPVTNTLINERPTRKPTKRVLAFPLADKPSSTTKKPQTTVNQEIRRTTGEADLRITTNRGRLPPSRMLRKTYVPVKVY